MPVTSDRRAKLRRRKRQFFGSPSAEHIQIDAADDDVVRYWAQELDVTVQALRSAVAEVGPNVAAVRERLRK